MLNRQEESCQWHQRNQRWMALVAAPDWLILQREETPRVQPSLIRRTPSQELASGRNSVNTMNNHNFRLVESEEMRTYRTRGRSVKYRTVSSRAANVANTLVRPSAIKRGFAVFGFKANSVWQKPLPDSTLPGGNSRLEKPPQDQSIA